MRKIKVALLWDNGKPKETISISYFLIQPRLLIIDGEHYVQVGQTQYQQSYPVHFKRKSEVANENSTD